MAHKPKINTLAVSNRITTETQYCKDAKLLFGEDMMKWRFICPACGHIASIEDYKNAGTTQGAIAFSCVGRWLPERQTMYTKNGGPCDYAGGGLFMLNPVSIEGKGNFFELDGYESLKKGNPQKEDL